MRSGNYRAIACNAASAGSERDSSESTSPLSSFVNLTTRSHLAQLILSGDVGTLYVDNIYFHN